jgi:CheY-like chemotaxis protein
MQQILLCEQNDELRPLAAEALEGHGFEVILSPSLPHAFGLVRGGARPHCLLLDVNIPPEACRNAMAELERALGGHRASVIFSSGRLDLPELARVSRVSWILPKPYELDGLVTVVSHACGITRVS